MLKKQFTFTEKDFNSIENIFFNYLKQNPNDLESKKFIQDFIEMSLDKNTPYFK